MSDCGSITEHIRRLALEEGFSAVGVAPARPPDGPWRQRFESWIAAGGHAGMEFLVRNPQDRFDPSRLVEGARSVICLAASYASAQADSPNPLIARYAQGRDYHKVLQSWCRRLIEQIRAIQPHLVAKAFVDSSPLAERSLAAAAGVGWIGRNGCLIVPGLGSYVVLAEIVCNLDLACSQPLANGCGDCDLCVRACPTGALGRDGLVDARRCLSYLSIEHAGPIDRAVWSAWGERLFGCDACQQACPHNRQLPAGDAELTGHGRAVPAGATLEQVLAWRENDWDAATRGSALRRAKLPTVQRNAVLAAGAARQAGLCLALERLRSGRADLAEMIDWAMDRCQGGPVR